MTPILYWRNKGVKRPGKVSDRDPCHWNSSTVVNILSLQEYCGDIINFKTFSKSYKNKTRYENDEENWAVFRGVHDPVIDRATWEKVQAKQRVIVHYNCIGPFEVPDWENIPDFDILIETRKGVTLCYSPLDKAV